MNDTNLNAEMDEILADVNEQKNILRQLEKEQQEIKQKLDDKSIIYDNREVKEEKINQLKNNLERVEKCIKNIRNEIKGKELEVGSKVLEKNLDDLKTNIRHLRRDVKGLMEGLQKNMKRGANTLNDKVQTGVRHARRDVKGLTEDLQTNMKRGANALMDKVQTGVRHARRDVKGLMYNFEKGIKKLEKRIEALIGKVAMFIKRHSKSKEKLIPATEMKEHTPHKRVLFFEQGGQNKPTSPDDTLGAKNKGPGTN